MQNYKYIYYIFHIIIYILIQLKLKVWTHMTEFMFIIILQIFLKFYE